MSTYNLLSDQYSEPARPLQAQLRPPKVDHIPFSRHRRKPMHPKHTAAFYCVRKSTRRGANNNKLNGGGIRIEVHLYEGFLRKAGFKEGDLLSVSIDSSGRLWIEEDTTWGNKLGRVKPNQTYKLRFSANLKGSPFLPWTGPIILGMDDLCFSRDRRLVFEAEKFNVR